MQDPSPQPSNLDLTTLAVIDGTFNAVTEEMSAVVLQTARTAVIKLAKDFSNGIFDWQGRQVVQGEKEMPVHVGTMVTSCKAVAKDFDGDIHPGDLFYHNDPSTGAAHLNDCTLFRPIFFQGELIFWAGVKLHHLDVGGTIPGGCYPEATDLYQEGIVFPALRVYSRGQPIDDVIGLMLRNFRYPELQEGDIKAQIAASAIAEQRLVAMIEKYGVPTIKSSVESIMSMTEKSVRKKLSALNDGVYYGEKCMGGRDGGESLRFESQVTIEGDYISVRVRSPHLPRDYRNTYFSTTYTAIYNTIITTVDLKPPFNEGLYRAVEVDPGEPGSMSNAELPSPCHATTTATYCTICDAVRVALLQAVPEDRQIAGWSMSGVYISFGTNPDDGKDYAHYHPYGSIGGSGASFTGDGWNGVGAENSAGGMLKESVELLEYDAPFLVHRCEVRPDSGYAGRNRGGLGFDFEYEARDHEQTVVVVTDTARHMPVNAGGATSKLTDIKLGRRYIVREGERIVVSGFSSADLRIGDHFLNCGQGGGGMGDPFERDPEKVAQDVRDGYVSIEGAREDYGIVFDDDGAVEKVLRGETKDTKRGEL